MPNAWKNNLINTQLFSTATAIKPIFGTGSGVQVVIFRAKSIEIL